MEEKSYSGGCHCGAVRFQVRVASNKVHACNCSLCHKKAFLHLIVNKEAFDLLSGQNNLRCYTFNTHTAKHLFCKTCGVQSYYVPRSHPDGISINLRCLDDVHTDDFDIRPFDGQNWETQVATIR